MPLTISVEEAQSSLKDLIEKLSQGDEVVITEQQKPVARLLIERTHTAPRPAPGLGKGSIVFMAPDFDEPLEEFQEYTE